jgi:hypothetical protein
MPTGKEDTEPTTWQNEARNCPPGTARCLGTAIPRGPTYNPPLRNYENTQACPRTQPREEKSLARKYVLLAEKTVKLRKGQKVMRVKKAVRPRHVEK